MATYTENYNLEKPAQSDLYNIDVFNENADKIDEALGDKAENQSLAPIESTSTASRNYSVGQQFVYNGLLYEATSAIASGGTITPGTNCARTTVAEELSALNDSFTAVTRGTATLNSNVASGRIRWVKTYYAVYIECYDLKFTSTATGNVIGDLGTTVESILSYNFIILVQGGNIRVTRTGELKYYASPGNTDYAEYHNGSIVLTTHGL